MIEGSYEVNQMRKNYPVKIVPHKDLFDSGGFVEKHWHRSIELVLAQYQPVHLWVSGIERTLKKNELVIINQGEVHGMTALSAVKKQGCSVLISYTFLREINPNIDHLWFEVGNDPKADEQMEQLILKIMEIYYEGGEWYNLRVRSVMYEMTYLLFTKYAQGKNDENIRCLKKAEFYKEIITYVNQHYKENIKMNDVAANFGYNPDYFSKSFKNYIGENFKDYLRRLRLYKARKELVLTDKSILDIAMENGFTDCKAFIRDFKNKFGETPLKYRKNTADL